jgi:AraC-like DNA-binding protein
MTQSILNGFLIFGIIQAFVFVGLFVSKKNRITADLIISIWLLLFAFHSLLILVNLNNSYPELFQTIPISLPLLYGPLLLMYINALTKTAGSKRTTLWHLLPFAVFLALTFLFYESLIFNKLLAFSGAISGLVYCLLALSKIKNHKKHIVHIFSSIKGVSLNWINKLVKGIVGICFGVFVLVVLKQIFYFNLPMNWLFIIIPVFISYIGYHGLKQQVIFQPVQNHLNSNIEFSKQCEDKSKSIVGAHYNKSGLQKKDMERIFISLEKIMQEDKLFLEPTLNLKELSNQVKIPQHHITQTLNSYANQTFYDYVNAYRIKFFIEKLKNGEANNFSLLGLALDSGFNSKSSFNRIFKNVTGFSPSEYKNKLS